MANKKITLDYILEQAQAFNERNPGIRYCIAVDFDKTLCDSRYPELGEPIIPIVRLVKALQAHPDIYLVLSTCRHGSALREAIKWLSEQGIHFDFVNENAPDRILWFGDTRKISCEMLIDDCCYNFNVEDFE